MERPRLTLALAALLALPVPSLPQDAISQRPLNGLVPARLVPDTRGLGFLVTADVVVQTLQLFARQYPHEGAVCYYGRIANGQVVLERVTEAAIDSSSLGHVWFPPDGPPAGCADRLGDHPLVATAHSHTFFCERLHESVSPEDAALLAQDGRQLLTLIYCLSTGRALALFAGDPRRVEFSFIERREQP